MRAMTVTLASILAIGLLSPAARLQGQPQEKGGEDDRTSDDVDKTAQGAGGG